MDCSNPFLGLEIVENKDWLNEVSMFGLHLHLNVKDEKKGLDNIKKLFSSNNIKINSIQKITPSLEDVFIHLIESK